MDGNGELDLLKQIKESVEKNGADVAKQWGEELRANRAKVRGASDQAEVDTEIITKKCTKCGEFKALDAFSADKRCKDGKRSACKGCVASAGCIYRQENKERIATQKRKYREENREQILEKDRKYRKENKEQIAEYMRKYQQENKDSISTRTRKYYEENKEHKREYNRKYRQDNKERIIEWDRRYREENPEVHRRKNRKRRALLRNLPHAPLTPAQYERLYEFRDQVFGEVTS